MRRTRDQHALMADGVFHATKEPVERGGQPADLVLMWGSRQSTSQVMWADGISFAGQARDGRERAPGQPPTADDRADGTKGDDRDEQLRETSRGLVDSGQRATGDDSTAVGQELDVERIDRAGSLEPASGVAQRQPGQLGRRATPGVDGRRRRIHQRGEDAGHGRVQGVDGRVILGQVIGDIRGVHLQCLLRRSAQAGFDL